MKIARDSQESQSESEKVLDPKLVDQEKLQDKAIPQTGAETDGINLTVDPTDNILFDDEDGEVSDGSFDSGSEKETTKERRPKDTSSSVSSSNSETENVENIESSENSSEDQDQADQERSRMKNSSGKSRSKWPKGGSKQEQLKRMCKDLKFRQLLDILIEEKLEKQSQRAFKI